MTMALLLLLIVQVSFWFLLSDEYWNNNLFLLANVLFSATIVMGILYFANVELKEHSKVQEVCMGNESKVVEVRYGNTSYYACMKGDTITFRTDKNVE